MVLWSTREPFRIFAVVCIIRRSAPNSRKRRPCNYGLIITLIHFLRTNLREEKDNQMIQHARGLADSGVTNFA